MLMSFPRRVIISLLIAYVATADLEINGAEKASVDAVILSSNNTSVNEKLDPIITNTKRDVQLENDSLSGKMKLVEAGDRRKMNNSSDSIGELANVGDKGKFDDSSVKGGDERGELKEGEGGKKGKDSSSEKQGRRERFYVMDFKSPDLSLLVQNKGKDTARISITAPNFVKLEQNNIELQGKENKKMKVSIGNGGNDFFIILKAGDGECSLDFRGLIDNTDKTSQFSYAIPSFGIMCLLAIALVATVLMYIKRRILVSNGHKYQKLDTRLPVSSGGNVEALSTDGWDNNWDDNWDDEEAPKAPSLPVTPSLSSKSISTRRSSKEGWKD
ncbi:unnamed protein product [Withania somnifera]